MEHIFTSKVMDNYGQFILLIVLMLFAFYPLFLFVRKIANTLLLKLVEVKKQNYIDSFEKHRLPFCLTHLFISIYLFFWSEIFQQAGLLSILVIHVKDTALSIYATVFVTSTLVGLIGVLTDIYKAKPIAKKFPIVVHTHIAKIVIICCAAVIIISKVLAVSVASLFTSIGAAAALLSFIFKDTLLGLVASLQLTLQDIVRVGDVVTIPEFNTEGEVEMITITVVKIRNTDQTVTTVPTISLLSTGIKNWRSMHEAGGRRIKRAVSIDIGTIKFCTPETLSYFKKLDFMQDYAKQYSEVFKGKAQITNLTLFRHYMNEYLKRHQEVHDQEFVLMVRYLDPTVTGLPVEIYAFTKDTTLTKYEEIQADIFDHILAILPKFELLPYQSPHA